MGSGARARLGGGSGVREPDGRGRLVGRCSGGAVPLGRWPEWRMGVSRQSHRLSVSGRSLKGARSSRRFAMAFGHP
ncbi:hypothetical protein GCM10010425_52470 [Streptomyces spororaveus]